MIIDKKGKLFGLINIIDLCAIVVVVVGGVFFGMRFMGSPAGASVIGVPTEPHYITFFAESAPGFVADFMNIGDRVEDEQRNIFMGDILDIEVGQGFMFVPDMYGNLIDAAQPGYVSLRITTSVEATPNINGVIISGNLYGVGRSLTIRAGDSLVFLRISSIQPVNP